MQPILLQFPRLIFILFLLTSKPMLIASETITLVKTASIYQIADSYVRVGKNNM